MPNPGALRFNTDSQKLELYDGNQWTEIVASSPDSQTGGARGVFAGGENPSDVATSHIGYITISTTGNSLTFGELSAARKLTTGSFASSTRGLWGGGYSPLVLNIIEYVTISSTGNAIDFGDLTIARWGVAGASSSTRGLFTGGTIGPGTIGAGVNEIEYVTIASIGNAVDFGDLQQEVAGSASCSSSTRAIVAGGVEDAPNAYVNTVNFITISTLGNASDFGDLVSVNAQFSSCSNSTRGLFGGGNAPTKTNVIQFITIATLGNAVDFGDLTSERIWPASCSSSTRGVFLGGNTPVGVNTIDFVTILTTGNAVDFGDTPSSTSTSSFGACSNGHGGL